MVGGVFMDLWTFLSRENELKDDLSATQDEIASNKEQIETFDIRKKCLIKINKLMNSKVKRLEKRIKELKKPKGKKK